jgi:2'-5' RNA ligase
MRHYCDYFLLLSPNEHIDEVIQQHKRYAASVIGHYPSEQPQAHISIDKRTRQKAFIAEPILESMKKGMQSMPPINLTIDGFDYFNHGNDYRTIYASLRSDHITTLWFKTLKKHLYLREFMVPHITICRNIPTADFEKLWPHFKAINWVENFTINELTILQRETFDTFAEWQPYLALPFEAKRLHAPAPPKMPIIKPDLRLQTRQMKLF